MPIRNVSTKVQSGREVGSVLSAEQKKQLVKQKARARKQREKAPKSVQDSIAYQEMFKDGICRVTDHYYTKCIQFGDINYQLAQNEDKTEVFEYWCDFYNYFDSSISLQLSCMSQYANVKEMEGSIDIARQDDEFNAIREEYDGVLKTQLAKGNNGLLRKKYVTFGIEAANVKEAKPKLERIESDILNNLKAMGVQAHSLPEQALLQRISLHQQALIFETTEPSAWEEPLVQYHFFRF